MTPNHNPERRNNDKPQASEYSRDSNLQRSFRNVPKATRDQQRKGFVETMRSLPPKYLKGMYNFAIHRPGWSGSFLIGATSGAMLGSNKGPVGALTGAGMGGLAGTVLYGGRKFLQGKEKFQRWDFKQVDTDDQENVEDDQDWLQSRDRVGEILLEDDRWCQFFDNKYDNVIWFLQRLCERGVISDENGYFSIDTEGYRVFSKLKMGLKSVEQKQALARCINGAFIQEWDEYQSSRNQQQPKYSEVNNNQRLQNKTMIGSSHPDHEFEIEDKRIYDDYFDSESQDNKGNYDRRRVETLREVQLSKESNEAMVLIVHSIHQYFRTVIEKLGIQDHVSSMYHDNSWVYRYLLEEISRSQDPHQAMRELFRNVNTQQMIVDYNLGEILSGLSPEVNNEIIKKLPNQDSRPEIIGLLRKAFNSPLMFSNQDATRLGSLVRKTLDSGLPSISQPELSNQQNTQEVSVPHKPVQSKEKEDRRLPRKKIFLFTSSQAPNKKDVILSETQETRTLKLELGTDHYNFLMQSLSLIYACQSSFQEEHVDMAFLRKCLEVLVIIFTKQNKSELVKEFGISALQNTLNENEVLTPEAKRSMCSDLEELFEKVTYDIFDVSNILSDRYQSHRRELDFGMSMERSL